MRIGWIGSLCIVTHIKKDDAWCEIKNIRYNLKAAWRRFFFLLT
jgi:hypothetical protein